MNFSIEFNLYIKLKIEYLNLYHLLFDGYFESIF